LIFRGPKPKLWRGYRNCDVCTCWRPVSDYPVYKSRSGFEQIKGECIACKRKKERARYDKLTPEQKRQRGIKANQQAKKRRNEALHEIERQRKVLDKQNVKLEKQWAKLESVRTRILHWENGEAYLDIVPFRMWLMRQHRLRDFDLTALAEEMNQDASRVRRWLDGFQWNGAGRDPIPIRSIKLTTVDDISVALEDPGLIDRLYPPLDAD
jgi:predicted RNase H-like nuclease (RuvC/YqgF family)